MSEIYTCPRCHFIVQIGRCTNGIWNIANLMKFAILEIFFWVLVSIFLNNSPTSLASRLKNMSWSKQICDVNSLKIVWLTLHDLHSITLSMEKFFLNPFWDWWCNPKNSNYLLMNLSCTFQNIHFWYMI